MPQTSLKCLALAMAFLTLAACSKSSESKDDKPVIVSVVTAKREPMANRIIASGSVEASATVVLKSLVDGQIKAVLFNEGDHVTEGQKLFQIDDSIIAAQIAASEAQKAKDEALAAQTASELARNQELAKRGSASKSQLDAAEAQSRAAAEAAKADQALVDQLKAQLDHYTILAPVAGRTGESAVKPGATVKANDVNGLVTINKISPARVRFAVPATSVAAVRDHFKTGDAIVMARLHGDPAPPATGRLAFIDNAVDSASGQLLAKGEFANTDESLLPGALADVTMDLGAPQMLVGIPETALQLGQDRAYVYVAAADDTAQQRDVQVAGRQDGTVYLTKGVGDGERVVVDGASRLAPGVKLEVKVVAAPDGATPSAGGPAASGASSSGVSQ